MQKYLADVGAAKIVQQNELNADVLVDFLEKQIVKLCCDGY